MGCLRSWTGMYLLWRLPRSGEAGTISFCWDLESESGVVWESECFFSVILTRVRRIQMGIRMDTNANRSEASSNFEIYRSNWLNRTILLYGRSRSRFGLRKVSSVQTRVTRGFETGFWRCDIVKLEYFEREGEGSSYKAFFLEMAKKMDWAVAWETGASTRILISNVLIYKGTQE